jgi:hypothetical protein
MRWGRHAGLGRGAELAASDPWFVNPHDPTVIVASTREVGHAHDHRFATSHPI